MCVAAPRVEARHVFGVFGVDGDCGDQRRQAFGLPFETFGVIAEVGLGQDHQRQGVRRESHRQIPLKPRDVEISVATGDKPHRFDIGGDALGANGMACRAAVQVGDRIKAAGPWLDGGDKPAGSLLIVEMGDRAELDAWLKQDPYAKAGLFDSVEAVPFKWVINAPEGLGA